MEAEREYQAGADASVIAFLPLMRMPKHIYKDPTPSWLGFMHGWMFPDIRETKTSKREGYIYTSWTGTIGRESCDCDCDCACINVTATALLHSHSHDH